MCYVKCFMCHDSTLPQTFAKPFNFQHQEGSCQSKKYSDHVWIKKCLQKLAYIFFSNAKISAKLHLSPVKMVWLVQKQPSRGAVRKRCSKNMQQIYRKTPMLKLQSNFIEITLRYGCSPVNLLHILRTPFSRSTSGRLLLLVHDFLTLTSPFREKHKVLTEFPAGNYLLNVNNRKIRKRCEICSKLTIKTPEPRQ